MKPVARRHDCLQDACMPAITIRHVPQETRDALATRAARAGQSLQEFLLAELGRIASTPTLDEWMEHIHASRGSRPGTEIGADEIVEWIAEGRRER